MDLVLACILALVGIPLAIVAARGIANTFRQFPIFRRRPINRLIPRRKCVVEGFARAEPALRAPLTGNPCIAWEARPRERSRPGLRWPDLRQLR